MWATKYVVVLAIGARFPTLTLFLPLVILRFAYQASWPSTFVVLFFSKFLKLQSNSSKQLNLNGHGDERADQTCGNWGPVEIRFWFYNLAKEQKLIQTEELLWDSSIYWVIQGHNPNISSPWASGRLLYEKTILPLFEKSRQFCPSWKKKKCRRSHGHFRNFACIINPLSSYNPGIQTC